MIDYARPYDQNMCDVYYPPTPHAPHTPQAPARLDDFAGVFKKGTAPHIYGSYYSVPPYDTYPDPDIESTVSVYHNMVACRDYYRDDWKKKFVVEWTEDDTVAWIIDAVQCLGISEFDVPYHNFRISGLELRSLKREDAQHRMAHLSIDPSMSRRIADNIFEKLQVRLNDDMMQSMSYERITFRYPETVDPYQQEHVQTVLDLDSLDHKTRAYNSLSDYRPNDSRLLPCDSSDDQEEVFRSSENASPECSYGSDGSKSGDEDDKRKMAKRPPGRPKGSGRKMIKRPRSVSVPEFLRNLLLDPKFCPSIIKWEDHSVGKFRFVKPDDVAKLWGKMKQNDHMTFEKFSRAMRYHYRQAVLVSVPTARLVYQFGHKGPDITTDNPNFVKVKSEHARDVFVGGDKYC